jgi:peptide/nickel transport system substrate-binding protein
LAHIGLILPPRYLQQVGEVEFGRQPVGTGAFRFVSWDPRRKEVRLAAYPRYWRDGYPKLDEVVYAYMPPDTALDRLIAGELDLIRRLNPRRTTQFMQTGTGRIIKAWLPQIVLGPFNLLRQNSPLRDVRVRKAINLAVNRDHLIRYGAVGNGRVLSGYTVPDDPLHAGLPPYPFSPAEARRLLAEAGHGGGLALSMVVDQQVPPQIENIVAVSLAQIGVALKVVRVTESQFLEEVYLTKFKDGRPPPSFDILLLSVPVGTIRHSGMVPMTLLYSGEPNESAVRDPHLDRLYDAALRARDTKEAGALWREIERYTYDNHLLFAGYQEKAVFGAAPDLHFVPRTLMSFWDAYFEPGRRRADRRGP